MSSVPVRSADCPTVVVGGSKSGKPSTAAAVSSMCESVYVLAVKGMWRGLQGAFAQAVKYVEGLGLTGCRKVMLTQGGRFYLFDRTQDGTSWDENPSGYFNVEKMRRSYVVPPGTDALESMVGLMPARLLGD